MKEKALSLVSLIVPAYNAEKTIERSISSIRNQTYENIEILIVDDGSTDGTADMCAAYQSDSRIKYLPVGHSGVSGVRNHGLEAATGKYVMFVDADDYVADNYVEIMVSALEENDSDMCICSYNRVIYGNLYPIKSLERRGVISRDQYLINTLRDPGHHYFGVIWNKIFRNDIIKENVIRFDSSITLGEDFVFSLEYLKYASRVNVIEDKLYYYCYQDVSTLSRIQKKTLTDCEREMDNRNKIYSVYVDDMKRAGLYERMKKRINHYWVVFYLRQRYDTRITYQWTDEEKKQWMNEILENDNVKSALGMFSGSEIELQYIGFCITQTAKNAVKKLIRATK